jgi:histidine triad (HIT) family protein
MADEKTVFSKIIDREIPATIEFEDDTCIVIRDLNPQAPVHLLVIPRKPIPRLSESNSGDTELLGHLLRVAQQVAAVCTDGTGFRVVINNGKKAGETVPHLHIHVLGNRSMCWPPG